MVDFIRKSTKKSLLAMLRKADKITPRLLARMFESFLSKDEFENYVAGGGTDHGTLGGLSDDDHTQYVRHNLSIAANDFLVGSGSNTFVKKTLAETGAILEADLDHGSIQGLSGDDHSQYLLADGTRELTDDWDAGAFEITADYLSANEDVDAGGDITAGGALSGDDLSVSTDGDIAGTLTVDTINEHTTDAGVTIEGILFEDNDVTVPIGGYIYCDHFELPFGGSYFDFGDSVEVSGDITTSQAVKTDYVSEYNSGFGVTIDGVLVKDGGATLSAQFTAPVITQTDATLTLTASHYTVLCDGTSNTVTITLPSASGISGRVYNIKAINIDNAVTVDQTGAETIDGSTDAITLDLMEVITVQSDGTNWWII